MKHFVTNYFTSRNRCSDCAHKKTMHSRKGCMVINGFMDGGNRIDRPCRCREDYKVEYVSPVITSIPPYFNVTTEMITGRYGN